MDAGLVSVFITLCALVVFQQVYFMRQIQKLVDKLMSRDYADYQLANKPKPERAKVPENAPTPEDLRVLQGFHL